MAHSASAEAQINNSIRRLHRTSPLCWRSTESTVLMLLLGDGYRHKQWNPTLRKLGSVNTSQSNSTESHRPLPTKKMTSNLLDISSVRKSSRKTKLITSTNTRIGHCKSQKNKTHHQHEHQKRHRLPWPSIPTKHSPSSKTIQKWPFLKTQQEIQRWLLRTKWLPTFGLRPLGFEDLGRGALDPKGPEI